MAPALLRRREVSVDHGPCHVASIDFQPGGVHLAALGSGGRVAVHDFVLLRHASRCAACSPACRAGVGGPIGRGALFGGATCCVLRRRSSAARQHRWAERQRIGRGRLGPAESEAEPVLMIETGRRLALAKWDRRPGREFVLAAPSLQDRQVCVRSRAPSRPPPSASALLPLSVS